MDRQDETESLVFDAACLLQIGNPDIRSDKSWEDDRLDFIKKYSSWVIKHTYIAGKEGN